jgi:urease accessory protein UreF
MEAIRPHLNTARTEAAQWLGDWHPLVRQIAPGEGITQPQSTTVPHGGMVTSSVSLHAFLQDYKESVLLPHELPLVRQACEHMVRNKMNELLALDRALSKESWLKPYERDSCTAGRMHLERLKPLRDHRGILRYIRAVEAGEGNGWHLLVAGAALGLYAVPLRQGLMDYALHTFWNVVGQASQPLGLEKEDAASLVNDLGADLPGRIQAMFPAAHLKAV